MLDGDDGVVVCGEFGQVFGEEPSVCPDIVSLSSAQSPQLQSCSSTMPFSIPVFLESCSTVLASNLSQRDASSEIELLQNPTAPRVHHGDSNAIGVLVYANHILRDLQGRWRLLEQHEETVATGHQDACSNPTISHVCLQADICTILLHWQAEAFIVAANR
jgi:hypothetical protein